MITHKNNLVALLLLISFKPVKSMFELHESDGQVLATSAHTEKQVPGDTCPTLPNDILNMIFEYLPAENEFLNQWIRTHSPSPALIDKMVNAYVDNHFDTASTIESALQKHFTLFHSDPKVKKDVESKIYRALFKATSNDSERELSFFGYLLGKNTFSLDNVLFGKDIYGPCFALRPEELKSKSKEELLALKKAINKDLLFINVCLYHFSRARHSFQHYVNAKEKRDHYNQTVATAYTHAASCFPSKKAFLSWAALLTLTLFKPTKQADVITCIKFAFGCCSAMISLNVYPTMKALFISAGVGYHSAQHRFLSQMFATFPASTQTILDTLLDTKQQLVKLKEEVNSIETY